MLIVVLELYKIRPKSEFGNAQNGAMGRSSEDKSEPWDVHLAATIPRPRNAITVVAPPTAPVRRPTTALQRGTPPSLIDFLINFGRESRTNSETLSPYVP